ncbi:MAG: alpha/beta fold hydrolase [Bacteroidota bacterium]
MTPHSVAARPLIVVLIPLLAVLACNAVAPPVPTPFLLPSPLVQPTSALFPSPTPAPTGVPTIGYRPVFEPAACAFAVPPGYSPACGYLVVPENRMRADSRWLQLHLAIFPNRTGLRRSDAVIHLAGGPGSSSLEEAGYLFERGLGAVLDTRDLILFDQRGTGYSQPRLDCPERQALAPVLLEGHLPVEGNEQVILDAFRRCRDRLLAQGIDLSAYNSAASAADLNDLRQALGYEKLDLYAVSYGTRLALTLMRDYPQAVRSAVLDSVYPLQVNLYTALAPNAGRAFNVFFDRCAGDPACAASFPDLRTVFFRLAGELNADPIFVSLRAGGADRTVRVDGGLLVDVLFTGLYNPAVTASMPRMIFDIRQGDYAILRQRLALYFDSSSALGMQASVQCAEEIPFNTAQDAYAAAQGVEPEIAAYYPASVQPLFDLCREWTAVPPDPRENLPVSSAVPALILTGDGDPITPPDWGRMVAGEMSHAFYHEFPGNGHWVTRSSPCALRMALAFWIDPGTDPSGVCQQSN